MSAPRVRSWRLGLRRRVSSAELSLEFSTKFFGLRSLDEFSRIDTIKGQGSRNVLTAPKVRRGVVQEALKSCAPGEWIEIDELFEHMGVLGLTPTIPRSLRALGRLYLVNPSYGSFGHLGYQSWDLLEGRHTMAVLLTVLNGEPCRSPIEVPQPSSPAHQPPRQIRPTDVVDELRITAHDELVTGPGQSDVEPFAGPFELAGIIDNEDHTAPLEPFEAQHVAVEHLLGVPEAVPVDRVAVTLPFRLLRVAAAGGQQREVLRPPAFVEQQIDLVVADAHRLIAAARDVPNGRSLTAEEPHGVIDQRLEGTGDLTGVA